MSDPIDFDIQELLPDVALEGASLPRRQAGGNPQSLTVTLLADYTLRHHAWIPSAGLVSLLGEFGVTTDGARTAINRLARRGVVQAVRQGRRTPYQLTPAAAQALLVGGRQVVAFVQQAEAWDGTWRLVACTMPQERSADRRALRGRLRRLGYAPLFDGLWVSPRPVAEQTNQIVSDLGSTTGTAFQARRFELGSTAERDPLEAWDLTGIATAYEDFMARWTPSLGSLGAGDLHGREALRARKVS
ncbi:PaaX family transcriptional regulator [Streptomyces sp. NPDC047042]|uniref:PaaX family transcriptional regulator n=1 Tax=Streptomyces sp. NPDC047042 TaxID=3154807 RepID=UPI0033D40462